tara:strand:+ start:95 stop:412 length:318 start_codon:yes stop_codon:yes gene_type:complete
MRKIKLFFYFIFLICILSSCSGISDIPKILRNEKVKTTDEFLVKKREPLTQPPASKELPSPKSLKQDDKEEKLGIESILRKEKKSDTNESSTSSAEDFIISQIRK